MVAVVEFQNASIEYGPLIPAPGCPPSSTCMMSPSLYLVNSGFCFEDILSRPSNTRFDASLFSSRKVVAVLAALCCMLWGSAYPALKNELGRASCRERVCQYV